MRVRHSKRIWFVALGVFVAVFLFTFLAQRFGEKTEVEAASLANFDPGYIISDYQMGNYTSMTEAEIQAFLTSKNSCANTNYNYYVALSRNTNYTWHWDNGHFVCLSEERFGDGEVIGSGETAAHIIWQAAQDYKINPKVLIVLLQKETGLITDPIPNNGDYRKATGYGCPDTAACSSSYYGFKNQVRNAASLFRTVLNGGWTNYPLGNNYIQYNPSAACGGSWVNVKNLATSALYRYTPYQPNAGALAAGYGTASCGAYGNRNFYLYFEDWFGGITSESTIAEYYKANSSALGEALTAEICGLANGGCYRAFQNGYVYWSKSSGTHSVSGDIFKKWFSKGTEWGLLGYPTSDVTTARDGTKWQSFERGFIYQMAGAEAWDISGGILSAWQGDNKGALGYPTSSEQKNSAGTVYQAFEHGNIYWDGVSGWVIRDFAIAKWESLGGLKSKLGKVVNNGYCGLANGGCYQAFATGNIYWTEATGTYDVSGGIYQAYFQNGTEWGALGYPTSSEQKNSAGTVYQAFEHGNIYWDGVSGWVIRDFAIAKWESLGGLKSKLGKVVNNGYCGLANGGCYQAFATGNIYWTEATGTYDVSGGIYQAYFQNGTEWGALGYPTSSEQKNSAGTAYQAFEHGNIYWDAVTGARVEIK